MDAERLKRNLSYAIRFNCRATLVVLKGAVELVLVQQPLPMWAVVQGKKIGGK
jgi:hypothetical protein